MHNLMVALIFLALIILFGEALPVLLLWIFIAAIFIVAAAIIALFIALVIILTKAILKLI